MRGRDGRGRYGGMEPGQRVILDRTDVLRVVIKVYKNHHSARVAGGYSEKRGVLWQRIG